uniref:Uncharacterized protein n=1 Tax=Solanum tuberosum TaxID=4113 RepID=M1BB65_SOLTU
MSARETAYFEEYAIIESVTTEIPAEAPQHLEQLKKSFHFRVRVAMAKNRNKRRNGLAAMDVSTDQTVMDAQAMDTSAPTMV